MQDASPWLRLDGRKSEVRTCRRLLRRIRPHLKEKAMSRPHATVRRVGRRPTANPKSEIGWTAGIPNS